MFNLHTSRCFEVYRSVVFSIFPFEKKPLPRTVERHSPSFLPPDPLQPLTATPLPVSPTWPVLQISYEGIPVCCVPWLASSSQYGSVLLLHGWVVLHHLGRPHSVHRWMVVWVTPTFWLLSVMLLWTLFFILNPPTLREDPEILGGWRCQKVGWRGQWDLSLGNRIPPKTFSEPLLNACPLGHAQWSGNH